MHRLLQNSLSGKVQRTKHCCALKTALPREDEEKCKFFSDVGGGRIKSFFIHSTIGFPVYYYLEFTDEANPICPNFNEDFVAEVNAGLAASEMIKTPLGLPAAAHVVRVSFVNLRRLTHSWQNMCMWYNCPTKLRYPERKFCLVVSRNLKCCGTSDRN